VCSKLAPAVSIVEVAGATFTLAEDDLNRARELLAKQIPAPGETNDLRGFEWRYLWQQSQSAELTTLGQRCPGPPFASHRTDSLLQISSTSSSGITGRKLIATLRDATIQPMDRNDLVAKALAFSPDGG
jgi:hypothetical protein